MSLAICLNPQQVEERLARLGIPCAFTAEELRRFETTPVVRTEQPLFGFPTPTASVALTLRNIRDKAGIDPRKPPCIADHFWYVAESFMETACPAGWHFLSMDALPGSLQQPYAYHRSLESSGWELPLAVEVVLMLFLHFLGTGENLFLKKHTWCADTASGDRRVTVGAFGRNGVFLSSHPRGYSSVGLGICGKTAKQAAGLADNAV